MWEIRRRRTYIEQKEARQLLHDMRVVNAGFNGGESAASLQKELKPRAFPPILTLEDKKKPKLNWMARMLQNIQND